STSRLPPRTTTGSTPGTAFATTAHRSTSPAGRPSGRCGATPAPRSGARPRDPVEQLGHELALTGGEVGQVRQAGAEGDGGGDGADVRTGPVCLDVRRDRCEDRLAGDRGELQVPLLLGCADEREDRPAPRGVDEAGGAL